MNDDLIGRSALKESIRKRLGISSLKYLTEQEKVIVDEIDKASTACRDNYSMGYQDGVKKVLSERPTGEWIENKGKDLRDCFYTCSQCGRTINVICGETLSDFPFCHCGADMRKGGAK